MCRESSIHHSDEPHVRHETTAVIPVQNCYPTRRLSRWITLFSRFIFLPNWSRGCSLFFSFSFSFFLKGRTCCQKYSWTASLFLWWRKWFIYFTVTSALKWQQGIAWRAWGPVSPWAPEVFMGIWKVSRTWLPQGSEHTHILFSLCPLKSPNFKGYWDNVGSHTSVQSKAALSSLPGRQCLLVLLQGLAALPVPASTRISALSLPGSNPPMQMTWALSKARLEDQ